MIFLHLCLITIGEKKLGPYYKVYKVSLMHDWLIGLIIGYTCWTNNVFEKLDFQELIGTKNFVLDPKP